MKETTDNQGYELEQYRNDSSVLQIRLNADYVLNNFKIFLTGEVQTAVYDKDGNPFMEKRQIAKKKANDEGIQFLLSYAQTVINAQVVQGNFSYEQYQNYISEVHDGIIVNLMNNLHSWGVSEDDYESIIDEFMNLVQPFISRLINNKERESYAATIKTVESSNIAQSRGGLFK